MLFSSLHHSAIGMAMRQQQHVNPDIYISNNWIAWAWINIDFYIKLTNRKQFQPKWLQCNAKNVTNWNDWICEKESLALSQRKWHELGRARRRCKVNVKHTWTIWTKTCIFIFLNHIEWLVFCFCLFYAIACDFQCHLQVSWRIFCSHFVRLLLHTFVDCVQN